MNPRVRKVLIWIAYPAFYLFSFFVFAYFTFPFERLRDRVVVAFAEDQRKTGGTMRLEIDDISSYWFSGIEAEGVRLVSPPSVEKDGTPKPGSEIEVERATARVSILPLLIGRVSLSFSADMLGGSLEGSTKRSGEDREMEIEVENLAIGRFDPLVEMVGLPMGGELTGQANVTLPEGKLSKAGGSVKMTIRDFSVADGKTKIKETIALPKMNVGDVELDAELTTGVVKLKKLAAGGQDLDFSADGKITLRDKFAESQADVFMKFRFADKYKTKNDKTKALFGAPGSKAPALFEIADPKIRKSKRPDGYYSWRIWGLLRTLRFDPAPTGAVSGKPGRKPAGGVKGFLR